MNIYIINSFILQNKNTLIDIHKYVKTHYNNSIEIKYIKKEIRKLIHNKILLLYNNIYELSKEGNVILNNNIYYYTSIISNFYRIYIEKNKKYQLREIRKEQHYLRNYLITNKEHVCIICDKKLPLCLLETAHLKPRCILNKLEINDKNIVEFMCRYCHTLYDNGYISIYNKCLQISKYINQYDIHYIENKEITCYNSLNEKYFIFHYNFIFKK